MRISDWSSDVCSSDLNVSLEEAAEFARGWMQAHMSPPWPEQRFQTEFTGLMNHDVERHGPMPQFAPPGAPVVYDRQTGEIIERPAANRKIGRAHAELQSLMRT